MLEDMDSQSYLTNWTQWTSWIHMIKCVRWHLILSESDESLTDMFLMMSDSIEGIRYDDLGTRKVQSACITVLWV